MLDDRLSRTQDVGVRDMMEKKQQFVRRGVRGFIHLRDGCAILIDIPRARGCRAIHADAVVVGAMPLSPAVSFGGLDSRSEMAAQNIGDRACAKWTRVTFIESPGRGKHEFDGAYYSRVVPKSEAS